MRAFAVPALLASFLTLGGCLSETQTVKVNADGSGTITITTVMKKAAVEKMKEMMKAFGGAEGAQKDPELFTETQAKDKAAKLGEGVTFVKSEKIDTKEDLGQKATYSFKDITKVKVSGEPESPAAGGPGGGFQAQMKGEPMTFKFAKQANGNLLLTVVNPVKEPPKKTEADPAVPGGPEPGEEQIAMMKELFAGFKVSLQLEVAGKIVKTNSPHVAGSTVTLMEIDFEKLFGDLPKLKKLMSGPQPKTLEEAKGLMKDFPGIKVSMDPEITVEFSGN